jgi:hypothetical protein
MIFIAIAAECAIDGIFGHGTFTCKGSLCVERPFATDVQPHLQRLSPCRSPSGAFCIPNLISWSPELRLSDDPVSVLSRARDRHPFFLHTEILGNLQERVPPSISCRLPASGLFGRLSESARSAIGAERSRLTVIVISRSQTASTGRDGDGERSGFSGFSLRATKCQASIPPIRFAISSALKTTFERWRPQCRFRTLV